MVNDNTININEALNKIDQYRYDYEKRFITTTAVLSASGLAFCFSTSKNFESPEKFLVAMLPSLWSFVVALCLSGLVPVVKRNEYVFIRRATYNKGLVENSPATQTLRTKKDQLILKASADSKASKKWKGLADVFMWMSAVAILFALVWPLILLSCKGAIY